MTSSSSSPALQEATKNSTTAWQGNLDSLFHHARDRFPDVVWELGGTDDDDNERGRDVEEIWGHKAIVYARAPPSFQTRYFSFRPNATTPYSASPMETPPTTSALSLDIPQSFSRTPSPLRSSSPAPSTVGPGTLLRLSTAISPALFSDELEYLYTGQGFGEAFEFLFDSSETPHEEANAEELRIDKLRKDLVFMWRSRLYSDVRIALTGNFSTNHESTTAIFSSHRFILVSRSPYFHAALIAWPSPASKQPPNEPLTLNLPSPPFTPASLHFTLGFIYTGTLIFSHRSYDLDTAFHIMRSATYLSLQTLYDEIQARIVQEMLHGLFHAFLEWTEYERITAGSWGTGGCRCRQCARRTPRVLEFALADDVQNQILEHGARRALVGLFGEGWCTPEFAALPLKIREGLLRGVGKRTTPKNAFALLYAAEHALAKLASVIDPWATEVRDMVLMGRTTVDGVICADSEACFAQPEWGELMETDGVRFEDGERVEWVMTAISRGVNEKNAAMLYQTLVSSILLRLHPTEINTPMLSSTSHIRVQVEQARMDVLRWIGKRWLVVRQEGGFDELESWAIKEISDNIEVPLEDLISAPVRTRASYNKSSNTALRAKDADSNNDSISMLSSMRVSLLSRNLPRRETTATTTSATTTSPAGSQLGSVARANVRLGAAAARGRKGAGMRIEKRKTNGEEGKDESGDGDAEGGDGGLRPDSKLTPALPFIGLPSYSRSTLASPTPQPSIVDPLKNEDAAGEDEEHAEDQSEAERNVQCDIEARGEGERESTSNSLYGEPHNENTLLASLQVTDIKRVLPQAPEPVTKTAIVTSLGGIRPRSSASSIRSSASIDSRASTIRKSPGSSSAKLRPPSLSSRGALSKSTSLASSSLSLSMSNSRPPSSVSNISDGSTTFKTANSTATRSRRTSTASTLSNISVSGRSASGASVGSAVSRATPPRPSSRSAAMARVKKASTGMATSPAKNSASMPAKRPPMPALDQIKMNSATAKKPMSITPPLRSAPSVMSMAASGVAQKGIGVGRRPMAVSVSTATDMKTLVLSMASPVKGQQQTRSSTSTLGPASTPSSSLAAKDKSRATALAINHKKTGSTISTGSSSTLKRKGSNDTITKTAAAIPATTSIYDAGAVFANNKSAAPALAPLPLNLPLARRGATLDIGIPCIISSKRKRFKAYARYIGEVEGELGPWVGVEVPVGESWGGRDGDADRQWNDGTWGGIRYFEIGSAVESEWEYGGYGDDRAARRRRVDWTSGSGGGSGKGILKREGDQLSIGRVKRFRSVSPAVSDASGTESRGLFVRPQQVLYVVDAVGSDL